MSGAFAFILGGVFLNATAQLLLKAGTNAIGQLHLDGNLATLLRSVALDPYILAGVGCYGVSLVVWIIGLSRVPVSVAYPMLSIGYVINAIAAWYLFGEALTVMKTAGTGCIIVGVCLIVRS